METPSIQHRASGAINKKDRNAFSRLFLLVFLLIALAGSISAQTGLPISGQVVTKTGVPASRAQMTVCAYNANGIPCYPQMAIYADSGLTIPLTQPYSTDTFGNYNFWIARSNPVAMMQIKVDNSTTYIYYQNGGGSGTISPGTAGHIAYYSSTGQNLSGSLCVVDSLGNLVCPTSAQLSNPPGGPATALRNATQNYADTSQAINITSLGCKGDGTAFTTSGTWTDNTSCIQAALNSLNGKTYLFPPGVYNISDCLQIPASQKWALKGMGSYNGVVIQQTTSGKCALNFAAENTAHFEISNISFYHVSPQAAPTSTFDNAPASAITINTATHLSAGIYQFSIHDVYWTNFSRGISAYKPASGFAEVVWGFDIHNVHSEKTTLSGTPCAAPTTYQNCGLQGATINFMVNPSTNGGQPRAFIYNIYAQNLSLEPQFAFANMDALVMGAIESNNTQDTVMYFYGAHATITGLHVEQHTQNTAYTTGTSVAVIVAPNSYITVNQARVESHICPSTSSCAAANPAALVFANNRAGGAGAGYFDISDVSIEPYINSSIYAVQYIVDPGSTPLIASSVRGSRGATNDLYPFMASNTLFWYANQTLSNNYLTWTPLALNQGTYPQWIRTSTATSSGYSTFGPSSTGSALAALYMALPYSATTGAMGSLEMDGVGAWTIRWCTAPTFTNYAPAALTSQPSCPVQSLKITPNLSSSQHPGIDVSGFDSTAIFKGSVSGIVAMYNGSSLSLAAGDIPMAYNSNGRLAASGYNASNRIPANFVTALGAQSYLASSGDPGTTANVPMVSDGAHGQIAWASGALGSAATHAYSDFDPAGSAAARAGNGECLNDNFEVADTITGPTCATVQTHQLYHKGPEMVFPLLTGGSSNFLQYGGQLEDTTFTYAISIISVDGFNTSTLTGCTTQPIITISNKNGTTLTYTLANSSHTWTLASGSLPLAVDAGKGISSQMTTLAAGCSSYAGNPAFYLHYQMVQ